MKKRRSRVPRPLGVTIAVWLQTAQGITLLYFGVASAIMAANGLDWAAPWLSPAAVGRIARLGLPVAAILFALAALVVAYALLRLRRRAWPWAMALQGLGLFALLVAYFRQRPAYLAMLVGIIVVLFLNQQEVQSAFSRRARE